MCNIYRVSDIWRMGMRINDNKKTLNFLNFAITSVLRDPSYSWQNSMQRIFCVADFRDIMSTVSLGIRAYSAIRLLTHWVI